MKIDERKRVELYIEQAYKAHRSSNDDIWITALWASRIVGKYEYGATLSLAAKLCVEEDTVEDYAHAYKIFEELCTAHDGLYRTVTFNARRAPFIYYSHFRVLYEARDRYKLTIEQVFMYLMEIIQAEGDLSARALERLLKRQHDGDLNWEWYAKNVIKSINMALQQPDLPDDIREVLSPAYEKLGSR